MIPYDAEKVVILTGAGVSAESGLRTFRDHNGLWEGHKVEEVATPEAFQNDPELVHKFYNMRRAQLPEVEPNSAHHAIAEFEQSFEGDFLLITQNVDNLHERAGSGNILHIHGRIDQARCTETGKIYEWSEPLSTSTPNPNSSLPNGTLRPHICWFGEVPFFMDEVMQAVSEADLFVAIGTSGVVYPAAGLVQMTPAHCHRVLINMEESENTSQFEQSLLGPATEVVPQFFTR